MLRLRESALRPQITFDLAGAKWSAQSTNGRVEIVALRRSVLPRLAFAILTIAALLSILSQGVNAEPFRTVAFTGEQAPGMAASQLFSSFDSVVINDLSQVAF